jgi:hypothetical protein
MSSHGLTCIDQDGSYSAHAHHLVAQQWRVACHISDPRTHLGARLFLRNVVYVGLTRLQSVILPNDLWYVVLAYPTVMLYGNSVLGNLNTRAVLRNGSGSVPSSNSYALSSRITHGGGRGLGAPRSADRSDPIELVSCCTLMQDSMINVIMGAAP